VASCNVPRARDGKEAVKLAIKACELSNWTYWGYIDTLAAAYAEAGDFKHAVKYQKQVLEMVEKSTDHPELRRRLALFQAHKPYREDVN